MATITTRSGKGAPLTTTELDANFTNLNADKVDNTQVLTNVPASAVFTDTIYSHPASHSISTITNLQNSLDTLENSHISLTLDGGYF